MSPKRGRASSLYFCLNLIEIDRQLSVRTHFVSYDIRKDLLMSRPQAKFSVVSILQSPHLRALGRPSAGFLPEFGRLNRRHENLLSSRMIHLFSHDIFTFFRTLRHKTVDAGNQLAGSCLHGAYKYDSEAPPLQALPSEF